jgi:hypothetical protein
MWLTHKSDIVIGLVGVEYTCHGRDIA